MSIITLEELKIQLQIEKITTTLTDEELNLLLNDTIDKLIGETNLPINPETHKQIIPNFRSETIQLDYYPLLIIDSLQIGNTILEDNDYFLDEENGIIYLQSFMTGFCVINYTVQIQDPVFLKVNPLIFDMIKLKLKNNFGETAVTSVKEGDLSKNYDTSNSLSGVIQQRINELKNLNSCRIRVL